MKKIWAIIICGLLFAATPNFASGNTGETKAGKVDVNVKDKKVISPDQSFKFPYNCEAPPSAEIAALCNEKESNQIAKSALAEDIRANNAAEKSADSSFLSAYVAGIAAILSFLGIVVSYFALREGRRSADAAVKALDIDRPMMMPEEPTFVAEFMIRNDGSISDCSILAQIPWKNVGKRVAFGVGMLVGITSRRTGWPLPELPIKIDVGDWVNVSPDDILNYKLDFTGMEAQIWLVSRESLYLYSAVTYQDQLDLDISRRRELILKVEDIQFSNFAKNIVHRVECELFAVKEPRESSFGNGHIRIEQFTAKVLKIAADRVLKAIENLIGFFLS